MVLFTAKITDSFRPGRSEIKPGSPAGIKRVAAPRGTAEPISFMPSSPASLPGGLRPRNNGSARVRVTLEYNNNTNIHTHTHIRLSTPEIFAIGTIESKRRVIYQRRVVKADVRVRARRDNGLAQSETSPSYEFPTATTTARAREL